MNLQALDFSVESPHKVKIRWGCGDSRNSVGQTYPRWDGWSYEIEFVDQTQPRSFLFFDPLIYLIMATGNIKPKGSSGHCRS